MLKRLELIGFKSFAEKTRFDFPPGITAVVGPNGSGKSNLVDAVKWILGEQSAKSLRGGEMADVIFNGSSTRRSLGLAEVTMTFDNARKSLNSDSEEVQITRRVYRDGTGEYLINNQICRLKDIKDLFLGSGAGTTAYCIIEQGRVDALLQASNSERRTIFEEAAGISRFKAKKIETLRKLDHVEQNLEQLRLIIGEVEKQYRKSSIESNRAKKYIEYSDRTKYLKLGLGLREYRESNRRIESQTAVVTELRGGLTVTRRDANEWEAEAGRLEAELQRVERDGQEVLVRLKDAGHRIVGHDAEQQHAWAKAEELRDECERVRKRGTELMFHLELIDRSVHDSDQLVRELDRQTTQQKERFVRREEEGEALERDLEQSLAQIEADRLRQFELFRQASILHTQAESARQHLERLNNEREQKKRRREQRDIELLSLDRVVQNLSHADADLQLKLTTLKESLQESLKDRESLKRLAAHLAQEQAGRTVERSNLRGRIETLEMWERTQEGLSAGVREAVALRGKEPRAAEVIFGLVADLLNVPRELAALVDVVLGETAQRFVARDRDELDRLLRAQAEPFSGRVGFIPFSPQDALPEGDETTTIDRWVTCDHPGLEGLPRQLLGNVLVVSDLAAARDLNRDPECRGFRFVTRQGELLDADGTLTVGTTRLEGGIVSRKSELRSLRVFAEHLDKQIRDNETRLRDLENRIEALDLPIQGYEQEISFMTDKAGDLHSQMLQHQQTRTRIEEELNLLESENRILQDELDRVDTHYRESLQQALDIEAGSRDIEARLESTSVSIREREAEKLRLQQELTQSQVLLAQLQERLHAATQKHAQLQADAARGRDELDRISRHRSVLATRRDELDLQILARSGELANLFSRKDRLEADARALSRERVELYQRRQRLAEQLQQARAVSQDQLSNLHQLELKLRDAQNNLQTLLHRVLSEYQVDLATLGIDTLSPPAFEGGAAYSFLDDDLPLQEVNEELLDLQKRITTLGRNVNLDSIAEFEEVEKRSKELKGQHDDLTSSQRSLMEIIDKINTDSRAIFATTFESIRKEFQDLFRKLFAGGQADAILENPDDVLESGIEILARPPGKELRSISLMSGGEKTLTAVALLLAIFRSKPSPFCLLDEVDAALDEANTSRLASVIREFLDTSQFIVITHKKRTMAVADVLYGVTMQESGVSKQVAMRFEDWPDEENRAAENKAA